MRVALLLLGVAFAAVAPSPVRTFTDLFEPLEVHVYEWPEAGGG
jgi:hypothetical protein